MTMQQKKGFILFCMLLLCLLCTPVIHAEADEKNTVVLDNAIPIEGYFEFRCLGDGIHSDDVTDYMAATYQSIESGMLNQALPTTFFYNGHDHMYLRAHVGNTQIYRIGVLKYGGVEHVYYSAENTPDSGTTYAILKDGDKIVVDYIHTTAYQIDYRFEDHATGKEVAYGPDGSDVNAIFGVDTPTVIETNGNYTLNVSVPRGYQAWLRVTNADGSEVSLTGNEPVLGRQAKYQRNGNKISIVGESATPLTGLFGVHGVHSNQTVTLSYEPLGKCSFDASLWLTTPYANLTEKRVGLDGSQQGAIGEDHTYQWTFIGQTVASGGLMYTWEMDQLQLNGEAIKVPMTTMDHTEPVTDTTVLSSGTVVQMTVQSNGGQNGKDGKRTYTLTLSNCYENITVTGGNMVAHTHKEIAVYQLEGVVEAEYWIPTGGGTWNTMYMDSLIGRKQYNHFSDPFRVSRDIGHHKPKVSLTDKNGTPLPANCLQYLVLKPGITDANAAKTVSGDLTLYADSNFTIVDNYEDWVESPDGYYYFRGTQATQNYMNQSNEKDEKGVALLIVDADPVATAIQYVSGADGANAPAAADVVNMPSVDLGGSTGYNVDTHPTMAFSAATPRDVTNQYAFDHWEILLADPVNGPLDTAKEGYAIRVGQSMELTLDLFQQLNDCFYWDNQTQRSVITLRAVWKSQSLMQAVNYTTRYFVDGQEIYDETRAVNKGATVLALLYEDGTDNLSPAICRMLAGENHLHTVFKGAYRVDLSQTVATLTNVQPDHNTLLIYLYRTDVDLTAQKQWQGQFDGIDAVNVQLQRRNEDGGWIRVQDASLTRQNQWQYTFEGLPKYVNDQPETPVQYRVVELYQGQPVENGSTIRLENTAYVVTYDQQDQTCIVLNTQKQEKTGELRVEKQVEGLQGDKSREWHFTLTLSEALNGAYGEMTFTDGVAQFTLKHGESLTAVNLPENTRYQVEERENGQEGYQTMASNAQGVIQDGLLQQATFVNQKNLSPVQVQLQAKTLLDGQPPQDAFFTYEMLDDSGSLVQVQPNAGGNVSFDSITFEQTGEYVYYLLQRTVVQDGLVCDTSVYQAIITVKEGGDALEYQLEYLLEGEPLATDIPLFLNYTVKPPVTTISRTVRKVWTTPAGMQQPDQVQVQLYANGTPFGGPVTLNAANGWRYTWRELDDSIAWTVDEPNPPDGYRREIHATDEGWTIENIGTKPGAETPPQTGDSFPVAALWSLCVLALLGALACLPHPRKR